MDAAAVSEGRLNVLQGLFYGSAGALILLSTLLGAFPDGDRLTIYLVGAVTSVIGLVLLAPWTPELPGWAHNGLSVLGGLAVAFGAYIAGPTHLELAGLVAVYVTAFAFVMARRLVPITVPIAALAHLWVLHHLEASGPWGIWVGTWGISIVAGWVSGAVVQSHRRSLAEQQRLVEELANADDAKTALLHAVGHELSRPMTTMRGLSETLAERGEQLDPDDRRELAERIAHGTIRLNETLQELLGLGRLSTGRVALDLKRVSLRALIANAVDRSGLDPEGLQVHVATDIELVVDPFRLAHALSNLLTNARRYGGDGDTELSAEVVRRTSAPGTQAQDEIVVRVRDHGPGIPEDQKSAVFEPFVRAHRDHVPVGSGLGLSLVRQFLRLHGGTAWLEDAPGGGTVAIVCFPQQAEPPDVVQTTPTDA
jgi:signal transduction histidine kinase